MIWIQIRDVDAGHARLTAAGVPIIRGPATEPWGLTEMWLQDPDGIQIVLAGVPADHPSAATHDRHHRARKGRARHTRQHGGDAIGGCSRALRRPQLPQHCANHGLCPARPLAIL
jgi:glyoxalase/bleomycin resistance protein/dioxygenase superfamily protein